MKKNQESVTDAPGADVPLEVPTIAQVEKWLSKDLSVAINCLHAIHSDPDLLRSVATFMHGRLLNDKLKKEVDKVQTKLEI